MAFWSKKKSDEISDPSELEEISSLKPRNKASSAEANFPKEPTLAETSFNASLQGPTPEEILLAEDESKRMLQVRARRRFIGAAMILLAVVVVVPFLFDKEPPPPSVTIPLRIPNELGQQEAKLLVPGTASQQAVEKTDVQKQLDETTKQIGAKKTVEPTRPKPVSPVVSPAPSAVQSKPAAKMDKKEEPKVAKTSVTRGAPAAVAQQAKGKFVIQHIATANQKRAEEAAGKIRKMGLPVFLEPVAVKKGKVWRVRIGPFANKNEAENARAKLGLAGLSSSNVMKVD